MVRIVCLLACVLCLSAPAFAQVINGEGTYEGSSMHEPPAPDADQPVKPDGTGKADASRDRVAPSNRTDRN